MLRWWFEDRGYQVSTATGCKEALAALTDRTFDFALIDLQLADGDGIDLSQRLQRRLPSLTVILTRVDPQAALAEAAPEITFLEKPLQPMQLHQHFNELAPA